MSAAPCARRTPRGTGRADACGLSIQCCDRIAIAFRAKASPGFRRAERMIERNCLFVGSKGFQPAHQHFKELLARRLLSHIRVATREDRAVDFLYVRGKDSKC